MALGSTQPPTGMSTRNISWGKGGRCVGLTTLPLSCADCLKIWEPQPPGTLRACQGLKLDCFTFHWVEGPPHGSDYRLERNPPSTSLIVEIVHLPLKMGLKETPKHIRQK
jgi:hypothetical protein